MDTQMLTVNEVCDALSVSRWTVLRLIKANRLPVVRITPDTPRIPRMALQQLIEESTDHKSRVEEGGETVGKGAAQ